MAKRCIYPWCDVQASYGEPGGKAVFCCEHKTGDMVEKKQCVVKGCENEPTYNRPFYLPSFCRHHKTDDMVETTLV